MNQELSDCNQPNNEVNTFYEANKTMNILQLASADVSMLRDLEVLTFFCRNQSSFDEQQSQYYPSLTSAVSQLIKLSSFNFSKLPTYKMEHQTEQTLLLILSILPPISLQELNLNLKESYLFNSDVLTLTHILSRFINLKKLTLSMGQNKLNNEYSLKSIGDCLGSFKSLTFLSFQMLKQTFNEDGIISLANGISQQKNLKCLKLSLNYCLSNQVDSQPLARAISELSNLTDLILELREKDHECVSGYIYNLTDLFDLSIDQKFNSFPDTFLPPLLFGASNLTKLQKLEVNISAIQQLIQVQSISSIIINLHNLEVLKLDLSRFDFSTGSENFGKAIGTLLNLDTLWLKLPRNTLPDSDPYSNLLSGISKLVNLTSLTIRKYVHSSDVDSDNHLPNCLSMLINLRVLTIKIKKTAELILELNSFSLALTKLTRLQSLYLSLPYFTKGSAITNLGKGLETLSNLQELTLILKNTSIKGKEAKDFSKSISNLTNLSLFQLRLICNEKSIPSDFKSIFSGLRNLRKLTTISIHEEDDNYYLRYVLIKTIVSLVKINYYIEKS